MRRLSAIVLALLALLPAVARAEVPLDPVYAEAIAPTGVLGRIGWEPFPTSSIAAAPYGDGVPVVVVDTGVVTRPVADANGASEFSEGIDVDKDSGRCTSSRRWRPRADEDFDATLIDDADGHGTTVASLAVGPANGVYTVGVAPNATLLVLKVADDRRHLDNLSAVLRACALPRAANAIAAAGGTGVINISLGLSASDRETAAMIAPVVRAGALVVAAAGHPGGGVAQPARSLHVLAVGVPTAGWPASVDVVAPGAGPGVRVVRSTGAYESVAPAEPGDTSWASAVVSGAAAYLLSRTPGTAQQIAWRLRLGASGTRSAPMIDLRRAVAMDVPADDEIEPNDTVGLATRTFAIDGVLGTPWTGQCRSRRCASFAGIASRNDDPVDVWVVRTPPGRRLCATVVHGRGSVTGSIARVGPRSFAIRVAARTRLAAYEVRPRLCSGKPRVTLVARGARG